MRLLTVTHFYDTHGGGIECVAGRINGELAALGHETLWAACDEDLPIDGKVAEAVPLRCINMVERLTGLPMPIPSPSAVARLRAAVRSSDAVIVHDALYVTSIIASREARRCGKPVLLVQHIAAIPFRSPVLRAVMAAANAVVTGPMLRSADQVVFISETTAAHFDGLKLKRPPLLVFNGVDTSIFRPPRRGEKQQARSHLGIGLDRPVALFVGRFVEKKGLAILHEIASRRPDVAFSLAGQGPIDPEAWKLPNVRVHRGLAGERLAALYRAADIFVLPSVGEGFPLVVQEALATGLPILCGAESAAADRSAAQFLQGLPVDLSRPAETAEAFAAALDGTLGNPANPAASDWASARYSWSEAARRYEIALEALIGDCTLARATPEPGRRLIVPDVRPQASGSGR